MTNDFVSALLTPESAIPHLHHFCATLTAEPHVDTRPVYTIDRRCGMSQASVILPSSIDPSVRLTQGASWWLTGRAAKRDAAFQAYVSLHRAGLVNDHLLPSPRDGLGPPDEADVGQTPCRITPRERHNPWPTTRGCSSPIEVYRHRICIKENSTPRPDLSLILVTFGEIPPAKPLTLFWDGRTTFVVSLESSEPFNMSMCQLGLLQKTTRVLIYSARTASARDEDTADYALLVSPDIPFEDLAAWLDANQGSRNCLDRYVDDTSAIPPGFVRGEALHGQPHLFVRWVQPPDASEPHLQCRPFPRRRNLLRRTELQPEQPQRQPERTEVAGEKVVPARLCRVDSLPWERSRTSLFLPPLSHHIQRLLVAKSLCDTLLRPAHPVNLETIADAITCPSSQWPTNYQRLEYLGDSFLKFAVCIQLYQDHPLWHEGYLSQTKNSIVSNGSLTAAALRAGLDAFLLDTPFATRRWTVPKLRAEDPSAIETALPGKVLADVLEALIGASFVDGGYPSAWSTMSRFLKWIPDSMPSLSVSRTPRTRLAIPPELDETIDIVIGHTFGDRYIIWEALTHPSWRRDTSTGSYQRLEFLGDAILDMIIARRLYQSKPDLTESQMTQIKSAMVNANFLAYLCLGLGLEENVVQIREASTGGFERVIEKGRLELWRFMRHDSADIPAAQQSCARRFAQLRGQIRDHLSSKSTYPWATLARLGADKFFSDLIESIIGAIYIDSRGQIEACEAFLERIELTRYLDRVLQGQVAVEHPRATLGKMVRASPVHYNITRNIANGSLYDVVVTVDGEVLACVHGCPSKDECVVRGADLAVVKLESTHT